MLNVSNLQAELHYRRLKWLTKIILSPHDNLQLRAVLVGTLEIDTDGQQTRNPWIQQFIDAILRWRPRFPTLLLWKLTWLYMGNTSCPTLTI